MTGLFGGEVDDLEIDPIVAGLLKRLPKPGAAWPAAKQDQWLSLMGATFKMIYLEDQPPPVSK